VVKCAAAVLLEELEKQLPPWVIRERKEFLSKGFQVFDARKIVVAMTFRERFAAGHEEVEFGAHASPAIAQKTSGRSPTCYACQLRQRPSPKALSTSADWLLLRKILDLVQNADRHLSQNCGRLINMG
jgi:hypothetical protein